MAFLLTVVELTESISVHRARAYAVERTSWHLSAAGVIQLLT